MLRVYGSDLLFLLCLSDCNIGYRVVYFEVTLFTAALSIFTERFNCSNSLSKCAMYLLFAWTIINWDTASITNRNPELNWSSKYHNIIFFGQGDHTVKFMTHFGFGSV